MISKDIKVPADNISSWSASSRRTVFNCRANVEQRKVSEVRNRGTKTNRFQNRWTKLRTKVIIIIIIIIIIIQFFILMYCTNSQMANYRYSTNKQNNNNNKDNVHITTSQKTNFN
jgi:ATP-dependent Zn protease